MTTVNRPTSPHLSIYRWQISNTLSILHRMTGVGLYVGMFVLVGWLALAAYYPTQYARWHEYAISPVGRILLLGWTLAFYYHFANGIRHLFWDAGKGYTIPVMNRSGIFVVFFTLLMTGATWCYVYQQSGAAL